MAFSLSQGQKLGFESSSQSEFVRQSTGEVRTSQGMNVGKSAWGSHRALIRAHAQ